MESPNAIVLGFSISISVNYDNGKKERRES